MPFSRCIAAALADQLITQAEYGHYQDVYAGFEQDFRREMPPHEAAAEAARETFRYIEGDAAEQRRRTFLALAARDGVMARLDGFKDPRTGKKDPYAAARGLYDRLLPGRNGLAVEQQHEFWRTQAQAELDGAYSTWKRNMVGQRRNIPALQNVVRQCFGEATGDVGAEMLAAGWKRASELLRQAFNRFGGHIGHLEDWGLPQRHNAILIGRQGLEAWSADIAPLLDRGRMVDRATGRPLDDAGLKDVLDKVYNSIITSGWDDREPTSARGTALANRRDDSRVLHFKDADSWFAYQGKYGDADPINSMLAHIESMSRDVAHMQVMGPNPSTMLSLVQNTLSKRAALEGKPEKARLANVTLNKLYSNYSRSNAAPVRPRLAHWIDDIGNVLQSAQLGSAMIVAVPSDLNTQRLARAFNGLPEVKGLATLLKQMNPLDDSHRLLAIRLGLGAQHYGQVLGQQGRYIGEIYGHEWSRWINDRVLSASGLTPWTAAGRAAFGVDFLGHVADQAGREFGALDKPFSEMLQRYGIGKGEWETLRATPALEASGAKFIRPADIMARTDLEPGAALALASKLADAAQTETEFAVPSGSLAARAFTHGLDHPGEAISIFKRSAAMYRTFGMTLLLSHGRRMASIANRPDRLGRYAASLVIGSTLAGAMAIQAKEIIAGRDPRDMTDWRFWLNAMVVGGGGGIIGDFIYAGLQGTSDAGQGLGSIAAGPLGGLAGDVAQTVLSSKGIGPASQNPSATAKNFGTRSLEFAKRYTPGGNLWYMRLGLERYVWDQLQEQIDPGWTQRVPRIERWYQRQYGNDYWWHHGERAPERAPDAAAMTGANR